MMKTIKQLQSSLCGVLLILTLLTGCGSVIKSDEKPPILQNTVTDISVVMNDSIELKLEYLEGFDVNGDEFSFTILDGENYVANEYMIIPDNDYIGDLLVGIRLIDATGLLSSIDTIIISVLPDINEIFPLYVGAHWTYLDTFFLPAGDSLDSSEFEITGIYAPPVSGVSGDIYVGQWSNLLDQHGLALSFLYHSTDTTLTQIGAYSSSDTLIAPQIKFTYPISTGDNWEYAPLRYNNNMGQFYFDTIGIVDEQTDSAGVFVVDFLPTQMICTDSLIYVQVPAGIFECTEYSYSFLYDSTSTWGSRTRSLIDNHVTVKLYYATGVGYIQNLTYLDGNLVQKKVLATYDVEEK